MFPTVFADPSEVIIETLDNSHQLGICGDDTDVFCYNPYTATVDVGDTVIFSNTDSDIHYFTSGQLTDDDIGLDFDSGLLEKGNTFAWTPEIPGEFHYFCPIHPWMQGLIVVQQETLEEKPEEHVEETPKTLTIDEEKVEETPDPEPTVELDPLDDPAKCGLGTEFVDGICKVVVIDEEPTPEPIQTEGGGCLIATAAYGTELAPQVQFLREIRDNTVMSTASGTSFMTGFNQLYYSFSPTIADLERENPMFQEAVRAFITPMISTLSIMTLAEDGSEVEVLGLGISVIALNLGMYVGLPAFGIFKLYQFRQHK
jgi:plastocyanin